MRPRTTLILVVLGVTSLALGWRFGVRETPTEATSVAAGTPVFPGLAPKLANARRIEITHQGKTLVLTLHDGVWGIADRDNFPVDVNKLRSMLSGLAELRMTEARTAIRAEFPVLGVENASPPTSNSTLLRVLDGAGKPIAALIVGHRRVRTAGGVPESIYIRRPGEAQSWLAEGRLTVDADPQLWFDRDILNIDHTRIAAVAVTRGAAALSFARQGKTLAMTAPADHPPLDAYKLDDIARALEQLTLTDVQPAAREPGTPIGSAVFTTTDGLSITATVFKTAKDVWAQFSAAGTGSAQKEAARIEARVKGWAYGVGSWKEAALVPSLDMLKAAAAPASAPASPATSAPAPAAAAPAK
ncbi:MAG: DUF4340 domain-containing protein [Rhodospirillales bacterium]|nr:DUF4340 domain-containing protein [Rhodospirillales bacterium]MDE2574183.1 DUF4340 domain-containing protein [Rhodospirillales bacterium]